MNRTFAAIWLLAASSVQLAPAGQPDQLSANDKDFIELAGETDLLTVRIAQLAELHAESPKLKEFASELEREHSADLKALTAVAQKTGGIAPNTLDDPHMSAVKRLSKVKGKQFDHAFLKMVVNQHETALVSFKRQADHGFNPSLQAYARSTQPHLEAHLREAKQLASAAE